MAGNDPGFFEILENHIAKKDVVTQDEIVKAAKLDLEDVIINNKEYVRGYFEFERRMGKQGDDKVRQRNGTGYMPKAAFNALNVSTVSIPSNFAGLEAEMVPSRLVYQLFRIVEVIENEDYVEVTARHVWYDNLKNFTLWEPDKETSYSAAAVCRNILTNTISPVDSHVASDCKDTKKGTEFDYKQKNIVEAFLDPENGVCAKFGLSLLRDNWNFYCLKNVGYDRGFVVENGKNLLGVERTESIENLATRVAPIAKNSSGKIIWLDNSGNKYVDSTHINDYSCPFVEIYDTGMQVGKNGVTSQNVQQKLLEAAQKRFSDDHVDIPEVEMTIEFLSLGDTEEYAQYRGLDKVYLYDILTIHDTVRGYDYTAQVVGVEHDILTGMLNSVTIGKLNNWDGTRKIATWQVPEVDGGNIRLETIMAGSFEPGAINADDIASGAIQWVHFDAATINTLEANTATIADAHIQTADISFAQIKALTAESLIARDAVTDTYYIRKLAVDNAQFVHATVGELIVKAADNKYYKLTVNAQGALVPTEVTLTQGEIAAGVTSDGHGSIIETDLTVTDLSAANMKAINALIDKLTASRIDVDELFARTATINKLNTIDISNNTSLQLYVGDNYYAKKSGIGITDDGVEISGGKYVRIKSASGSTAAGKFIVESGNFTIDASGNVYVSGEIHAGANSVLGGWTLGANRFYSGSGSSYVALDSDSSGTYAIWAGNATAASAPFRVKRDGTVTLTKLLALGSDGTTETEVNLRTAGLWKLNGNTVTAFTNSGGYCTSITLTGGTTLNFSHAARTYTGSWSGSTYTVVDDLGTTVATTSVYLNTSGTGALFGATVTEGSPSGSTLVSTSGSLVENVSSKKVSLIINTIEKSSVSTQDTYDAGVSAGSGAVTLSAGGWQNGANRVTASNGEYVDVTLPSFSTSGGTSFTSHKTTVYFSTASVTGALASKEVDATTEYNSGWTGSYGAVTLSATGTKSLTYGESVTIYPKAKSSASATAANITSISYVVTAPADRYQTGYNQGKLDGIASVTITKVEQNGTINYSSGNYSVPVKATASNSATGTATITFAGTSAYNAGWNACRQEMLDSATTLQYYTGTVSYAWDAPHQSANRIQVLKPYVWHSTTLYTVPAAK